MGLSKRARFVVIVCIAVFALTAVTAMPAWALLDAQTLVDRLFGDLETVTIHDAEDIALPDAPCIDVRSTRGPPLS